MPPPLSVIMSAYNADRYLREALDSILNQTFRLFEFIIIDDGSTDGTPQILHEYKARDKRIEVISRPNKGLTISLNEALARANAPLIARMDCDDVAMPDRFEKQVQYFTDHPECVLLGSRVNLIDPFGGHIALGDYMKLTHEEIDADLLKGRGGSVVHPSAMMRADALWKVGGYREKYNNSEDLDLWLRLAEIGRVANLPDVLLKYRRHPDSVSHMKYENQWTLKKNIVAEAYARRGLKFPDNWTFNPWRPKPVDLQYREWGWQQLKAGNKAIARKNAWAALKTSPRSAASWKLLICALRGW
ncbi:MAG: glycosyltransferase [Burkholderiales bacterium]|nr:glycosyltransferase [Phycisphaerae bacterium]